MGYDLTQTKHFSSHNQLIILSVSPFIGSLWKIILILSSAAATNQESLLGVKAQITSLRL